jgi:hypothetical protein
VAKRIIIEEIHIRIFAPAGLPPARYRAMHPTLVDKRFFRKMKQAIQAAHVRLPVWRRPTLRSPAERAWQSNRQGARSPQNYPCRPREQKHIARERRGGQT